MSTLRTHVREGGYRNSLLWSLGLHVALPLLVLATAWLMPVRVIEFGAQAGGGGGGVMAAVLTDIAPQETSGGRDMAYPGIKPQPQVAPPPEEKPKPDPEPVQVDEKVFVEQQPAPEQKNPNPPTSRVQPPERPTKEEAQPGQIPTEPRPGKPGPTQGAAGTGEGGTPGDGSGVEIGTGGGTAEVDSWYVRQVRQRVSRNWLRTSMGEVASRVEAVVLFDVDSAGRIRNVGFESRSGVAAVDRAAERAVMASTPLPQPPARFRGVLLRFRAVFIFPPE